MGRLNSTRHVQSSKTLEQPPDMVRPIYISSSATGFSQQMPNRGNNHCPKKKKKKNHKSIHDLQRG